MASNDLYERAKREWEESQRSPSLVPAAPGSSLRERAEAALLEEQTRFSNVESNVFSTERMREPVLPESVEEDIPVDPVEGDPESFLGRLGLTGRGVAAGNTAGRATQRVDSAVREQSHIGEDIRGLVLPSNTPASAMFWEGLGISGMLNTYITGKEKRAAELGEALPGLRAKEKAAQARVQSIESLLGPESAHATVARAVGGFAANAEEQLLPTVAGMAGAFVGGPVGAAVAASVGSIPLYQTAYDGSYRKALETFEATPEEADDYATLMASLEFAPSALGGGASGAWTMAARRLGLRELTEEGVERALLGKVRSRTSRILGAGAIEAADEVAAGGLQDMAEVQLMDSDYFSNPQSRLAIAAQVAENADNLGRNIIERAVAGAIPGIGIATPAATYAYAAERGANTANDIANAQRNTREEFVRRQGQPPAPTPEPVVQPAAPVETAPIAESGPMATEEIVSEDTTAPVEETAAPAEDDTFVRQSDFGKINQAKRALGMDEQLYRDYLLDTTGKTSLKELTPEERIRVIEDMTGKPYQAPVQKKPKPKKEATAPGSVQAQIQQNASDLGLLNQTNTQPSGVTREQGARHQSVLRQIFKGLNKSNTQEDVDVRNLSRQGKVVFAPNPQSMGFTADDSSQASYDPDSGRMYVWTNNFADGDNVSAETVVAAMHEAGHAGGFTEREGRSGVLKFMLTDKNYDAVNNKIKEAARGGNAIAQRAVADALEAGKYALITPDMTDAQISEILAGDNYDALVEGLEVVPYLATHVTRARNKPLGRIAGAWTDMKAGMRAFSRENFGVEMEFDINELMSATQKFAAEAVATDTIRDPANKPKNKTQILNMVAGRKATGFSNAQDRDRIYQGYVDKKDRFEFSDSRSAITTDKETIDEFNSSTPVYLGELLGHESLYEQYPDATVIPTQYNPALPVGTASYDSDTNIIEVGPYEGNDRRLRSVLLHEVQHWIQEQEGLILGFNPDNLVDPAVKANKLQATSSINSLVGRLDLPAAIESLPEDLRKSWEEKAVGTADALVQAEIFLSDVWGNAHPDMDVRNRARRYSELNAQRAASEAVYQEQIDSSWDAYVRDYGETEARNTQRRANIDQETMDAALDPNPESEMAKANFSVPVERTHDAMKMLDKKNAKPKASANKADDFGLTKPSTFVEDNYRPEVVRWARQVYGALHAPNGRPIWQNFVEWFGDSQIVNEDGTPKVVYHGTHTNIDFAEFRKDYEYEIGTHVGTSAQSGDPRFVGGIYSSAGIPAGSGSPRIMPLYAKISNPLAVQDVFGAGPEDLMRAIEDGLEANDDTSAKTKAEISTLTEWFESNPEWTKADPKEAYMRAWERIRGLMHRLGYDGFSYRNMAEGFDRGEAGPSLGSRNYYPYATQFPETSYVILDPVQLKSTNNSGDYSARDTRLLNQRARNTQIVKHGTPHTFQNKSKEHPLGAFDLEFMGRGEGLQAVGYGFYFSGSWGVSDSTYRKSLSRREPRISSTAEDVATDAIVMSGDEFKNTITQSQLDSYIEHLKSTYDMAKKRVEAYGNLEERKKERDKFIAERVRTVRKSVDAEALQTIDLEFEDFMSNVADAAGREFDMEARAEHNQDLITINEHTTKIDILENSTPEQIEDLYNQRFMHNDDNGELYYVEIPADEELADWNSGYANQNDATKAAMMEADIDYGLDSRALNFRSFYYAMSNELGGEPAASRWFSDRGVYGHKFKPIFGAGKNQDYHNYVVYNPLDTKIVGRDAREKGQTRDEMIEWAKKVADRNDAKMRQWESDARLRLELGEGIAVPELFNMAANRRKDGARKPSRVPVWVSGLLGSSNGTTSQIREIKEHSISSPAMTRMLAENLEGQYRKAVSKVAKQRGITEERLDALIMDAVDAVDTKSNDYDTNRKAFTAAASRFGEAGKVLIEMRDMVDNISLDILADRAARVRAGEVMSESEKKAYKTILSNLGRYGHRQYAAHVRDNSFSDAVWKSYQKQQAGKKPLSAKEQENANRVVNAMKVLMDQIIIPDDTKLDKLSQDAIDRLYQTWKGRQNIDALSYDDKRAELAAMRDTINGDTDALYDQAERIAKEILGLENKENTGLIAEYYRGGKVNLGIMQERKKLPPEIRELMGEIKDPGMRLFVTAAKQADFVARNQMFMELSRVNDPYHVQPPGPSGRPSVNGMVELTGAAYGALEGFFVSPELNGLISDSVEQLATFETAVAMAVSKPQLITNKALLWALKKWQNMAALTKMMQIIGKPINFLFNFLGGPRMMLVNGNINPVHLANAFMTSMELIAYSARPSAAGDRARRVTANGITDSAFIGEVNSEQYRTLMRQLQKMVGDKPTLGSFRDAARKLGLSVKETYAMMDVMFKIANFYQQADAVLPAFYKAEGIKKTQAEIDREAADIVNKTNITYKRAAGFVKALERGGITQFGTYFYEVFRTEAANLDQGMRELARANAATTTKGRILMSIQATRRVAGQLSAWGLTAAVSKMMAEVTFGDDEDDKWLRYLLPEFMRGKDHAVVGKDADGRNVLIELSRLDPAGPATDIMRKMLNVNADPKVIAEEIFGLYIAPRIGSRLLAAGWASTVGDKTVPEPTVQQVLPGAYEHVLRAGSIVGVEDDTTKAWTRVAETFLPGMLDGLRKTNPKIMDEDGTANAIATLARGMGAYFVIPEPQKQMSFASRDYDDTVQNERRRVAQLANNYENITSSDVLSRLTRSRAAEFEAFKEAQNIYRGMQQLDLSQQEIGDILKSAKVSKSLRQQLFSGEFKSEAMSRRSFKTHKDNAVKRASTKAEKEKVAQKWDDAWEVISGVADD